MRNIINIINIERQSLLKGLAISFLLTLPFAFLPTIIKHGLSIRTIAERFNDSILYSFGFSLIVVIAAIIHNYNGLVDRKWYFDKPAFKDLEFYGRIDGVNSVVHDLETVLLGKIDNYFFRLNLVGIDRANPYLEIVPLIDLTEKEKEIDELKLEYNFQKNFFFGMRIKLSEIDLADSKAVRIILIKLAKKFNELNFESLELDENELENGL